ncbi:MAG: c-type cytochrome [Candidatus Methylomirabilaceae bacterium]
MSVLHHMGRFAIHIGLRVGGALGLVAGLTTCTTEKLVMSPIDAVLTDGKQIFRFDTFGDETFWTDTLRMHEVVQGVSPKTALGVGLKVDVDALPSSLVNQLKAGQVNLDDPATTVALLKLNAVVGVQARVDATNKITKFGTTCAICHSTVDNSLVKGIGHRLDGWPNRDLNPGLILSLSPALQDPAVQAVLTSWGPGNYDARWNHDGKNDPVVIPPAFGLAGTNLATYTGEGSIVYWNAYVAVTQMHGHGTFVDSRTGDDIHTTPDLVTPTLPALQQYQLSLTTPAPPAGSFDGAAAAKGQALFDGKAKCATCHTPPIFTDVGRGLHDPTEVCTDPLLAQRGTTGKYRTTPLRALWQHPPYFHNGSAVTLSDVVSHYNSCLTLGLTPQETADLVEYLKSL